MLFACMVNKSKFHCVQDRVSATTQRSIEDDTAAHTQSRLATTYEEDAPQFLSVPKQKPLKPSTPR